VVKGGAYERTIGFLSSSNPQISKKLHFFQLRLSKPHPSKVPARQKSKILHPNVNIQYQPHLHTLSLDLKMFRVPVFPIRVGGFGCWLGRGREKGEGRREKGEGRRMGRRNRREDKETDQKTPKNTNTKPTKP